MNARVQDLYELALNPDRSEDGYNALEALVPKYEDSIAAIIMLELRLIIPAQGMICTFGVRLARFNSEFCSI